jgi:agmatine/peptidylarginine deiminase
LTLGLAWRWPAEWEEQDAILLAWPHADTDWAANLADVQASYVALLSAICRFQRAVLIVPNAATEAEVRQRLQHDAHCAKRLSFVRAAYDDTWLRDSGPITLTVGNRVSDEHFLLNDFRFTGWGGKFEASRDDLLVSALFEAGKFRNARLRSWDFALEGGAIDGDGAGSILTTYHCLHERHPALSHGELSQQLALMLHADRVLMLEHGELQGDDTDAHIDTLARFAAVDAIVFQACDEISDPHHAPLSRMQAEIAELRTRQTQPYRLFPLPWAKPIHAQDGRRLAASYANFLIINGAVLMPAYGDAADTQAALVLQQAFPDRTVVPVPCRALIEQNGSLHCVTMQLPRGVLNV